MGIIERFGLFFLIAFFLVYWFKIRIRVPKGYKLPPGPPRKFLIGNLFDIPLEKEWQTYDKWSKVYGDLTYLNLCGASILFVNSHALCSELFEQRGGIYSNRFHSTMLNDLAGWDWSVATMQPGETWRRHRAIIHQYFGKPALTQYHGIFENSAKNLLYRLYQSPEKFEELPRYALGALIIEMVYGIKTLPTNDPYITVADNVIKLIAAASAPGAYFVDFIPILKYIPSWFPGAGFQKKAKRLGAEIAAMANVPFNVTKAAIETGNAPSSILGTFLRDLEDTKEYQTGEDEKTIRDVGAVAYMAGIDTTESTLLVFFLVMLLYPDVQKKAQKELDDVLGGDTFPSLDGRKNLPYVEALCKEVFRWHAVVPTGFPHMLKEDDTIGEYFVPKGTVVLGNAWSLLHSESVYGNDADIFNPERFLKPDAKYPDSAFGFGRRICPGRYFADTMVFIMISHILYTFSITPHEGPAGPELPDIDNCIPGLLSRPRPFKCKFTPRSSQSRAFLEQLSMLQ